MIDGIVNDQKAVVVSGTFTDGDGRVLTVVPFDVQAESIGQTTYADCGGHPIRSLRQLGQDTVISVIINQNNGFFRTANQIRHKLVGIKYLSVKKKRLVLAEVRFEPSSEPDL